MTLDPLPPVRVEAFELVIVAMPLVRPLRTAAGTRSHRDVLLVHVLGPDVEGWAECAAEPEPTYDAEFTGAAELVIRDHLLPRAWAGPTGDAPAPGTDLGVVRGRHVAHLDALTLGRHLSAVRGHHMARAAVELAVLDAQLRTAGRSLASWLGATAPSVPAGAALALHDDVDALLAEADEALAAGASRLRVKVAPGRAAEPLRALRAHAGSDVLLQADANGSFTRDDAQHVAELEQLDEVGLACLEQPLAPDDLLGHARLAERLVTPICLDEPLTSMGAIDAAHALGACTVVCLKPARLGGWVAARAAHDRCVELGLSVWVGGMLETGVGRAANVAVAALAGMSLPADLDPRPRYDHDLVASATPGPDGLVPVPDGPGTGAVPAGSGLATARRTLHRRP